LKEPVGGFKWVCTADPAVPEVVYGYALLDSGGTILYFSDLLPAPVTISAAGNFVELSAVLGYLQSVPYGNLPAL
jgi:hypothetical protein